MRFLCEEDASMSRKLFCLIAAASLLAGCEAKPPTEPPAKSVASAPPVTPRPPGTPGALPDDRTPVSEAPFTPQSAQGAADVVQTYFALAESGRYGEAWKLWAAGGQASGRSPEAFAADFARYQSYHALIGAPGAIEGAAGSLYVEVPVQAYGRTNDGREFHEIGAATLRRSNDVPGATAEQRRWRIASIALKPAP